MYLRNDLVISVLVVMCTFFFLDRQQQNKTQRRMNDMNKPRINSQRMAKIRKTTKTTNGKTKKNLTIETSYKINFLKHKRRNLKLKLQHKLLIKKQHVECSKSPQGDITTTLALYKTYTQTEELFLLSL